MRCALGPDGFAGGVPFNSLTKDNCERQGTLLLGRQGLALKGQIPRHPSRGYTVVHCQEETLGLADTEKVVLSLG